MCIELLGGTESIRIIFGMCIYSGYESTEIVRKLSLEYQ